MKPTVWMRCFFFLLILLVGLGHTAVVATTQVLFLLFFHILLLKKRADWENKRWFVCGLLCMGKGGNTDVLRYVIVVFLGSFQRGVFTTNGKTPFFHPGLSFRDLLWGFFFVSSFFVRFRFVAVLGLSNWGDSSDHFVVLYLLAITYLLPSPCSQKRN